jgi:5-methylcytosine-specific restriction endonuclease McrA
MTDGTYTEAAFPKHKPIRLNAKGMAKLRSQAMSRDGGRCVKCGSQWWLELSHKKPRGRGGSDTLDNVWILCKSCHVEYDLHGCPGHF